MLNERFNLLTRYRYLYDMYGQDINGAVETGPVQESHIVYVEGSYDQTRSLTLGAKVGGRVTDSAADGTADLVSNHAILGVLNMRYDVTQNWDVLAEVRRFEAIDAELGETSFLGVVSRDFGKYVKVGVGYNFGSFSDDLADLTFDDQGAFLNITASY